MGRYKTVDDEGKYLDPKNPNYQKLTVAIKDLKQAESDWYESRKDYFASLNGGSFNKSPTQIENKYDSDIGDEPWEYKSIFDSVNPSRNDKTGDRFVQDNFDGDSGVDVNTTLLVENGEDDEGDACSSLSHVLPALREETDSCDADPAPDVLNYESGRGAPGIDCLYDNLSLFGSGNAITGFYFVEGEDDDDGNPQFDSVTVFTGFGEVPFAWKPKSGYTKRDLSVMKAAGDSYESEVQPFLDDYISALSDFESTGGGNIDFDYEGGTIDSPWEGFKGKKVSYNRPGPNKFKPIVDQARGINQ